MRGIIAVLLQLAAVLYALVVFVIGGFSIMEGITSSLAIQQTENATILQQMYASQQVWNGAMLIGLGLIAFGIASLGCMLIEATGDIPRGSDTDQTDRTWSWQRESWISLAYVAASAGVLWCLWYFSR